MFREWWRRLFRRKQPVVAAPIIVKEPTFVEDFSTGKLDPAKWTVSTWAAPGGNPTHKGSFLAKNVSIVDGVLCLKLTQSTMSYGVASKGAEIATVEKFGYGIYEFSVKASSDSASPDVAGNPVSGSITGCFNYLPQSVTEIDIEVEGNHRSNLTQTTSWVNETLPNEHSEVSGLVMPNDTFISYKFVWKPGSIEFYRNNVLISTHTKVVPTEPAPFLFNHWGTNDATWGGEATPGVDRYMWVKRFSFTPL